MSYHSLAFLVNFLIAVSLNNILFRLYVLSFILYLFMLFAFLFNMMFLRCSPRFLSVIHCFHGGTLFHLQENSTKIVDFFFHFEKIRGKKEVAKIVQRSPMYASSSFLQWLHLT